MPLDALAIRYGTRLVASARVVSVTGAVCWLLAVILAAMVRRRELMGMRWPALDVDKPAAARTSHSRMRPDFPEPARDFQSTPSSFATRRARGLEVIRAFEPEAGDCLKDLTSAVVTRPPFPVRALLTFTPISRARRRAAGEATG